MTFARRCPTHRTRELDFNLDCPEGHHPMGQQEDGTYVESFVVVDRMTNRPIAYVTGMDCKWSETVRFEGGLAELAGRDSNGMLLSVA